MKTLIALYCRQMARVSMSDAGEWWFFHDPDWYWFNRRLAVKWLRRARKLEGHA